MLTPEIRSHLSHYSELGWSIIYGVHASKKPIPLWKGKRPIPLRELLYETNSYDARPGCIGKHPNFAVKLLQSGLCGLDIDNHPGGADGRENFAALLRVHGELPPTPTDSRGHSIFRTPVGFEFAKTATDLSPGVQLLGGRMDGQENIDHIVWLPPSLHPSGERYAWLPGLAPWEIEVAPLPNWVCDLAQKMWAESKSPVRRSASSPGVTISIESPEGADEPHLIGSNELSDIDSVLFRARRYLSKMPPAVSGQGGHNTTFRTACVLVIGFDLSIYDALPLMLEWNATCPPGDQWTEAELVHKLKGADARGGTRGELRDAPLPDVCGNYSSSNNAALLEWPSPESLAAAAERNRTRAEARRAKARALPLIPLIDRRDQFAGLRGEPHPETPEEIATAAALASRRYTFTYFDPIINADDGLGYLDLCPRYYQHAMYNHDESTMKICRHGCRCWKCDVCSIGLRRLYSPHFASLLTTQPTAAKPEIREKRTAPIYLTIIENPCKRSIEAFAARVNRLDGHYLAVVTEYGAPIARGLSDVRLPRSIPISPEEAAAIAREDIYAVNPESWGAAKCNPIYRSAAWALPQPEPSDNIDLGPVRKSDPEKLTDAIVDEGFEPKRYRAPARGIDLGYSFKVQQTDEARRDPAMAKYRMIDAMRRVIGRIEIRIDGDDPDAVEDFVFPSRSRQHRERFPAPSQAESTPNVIDPVATAGFGPLSIPLRTSTE